MKSKNLFIITILGLSTNVLAETIWKQVTLEDSSNKCANNEQYSFHYRETESNNLVIFFNGGGACWDYETCSSNNKQKYPINTFENSASLVYNKPKHWKGMLNLDNTNNPIKEWNILSLPYCTADLFSGSKTHTYKKDDNQVEINHHGKNNTLEAINWLSNKRSYDTVIIAGASSGGYGAMFNIEDIKRKINAKNIIVQFDASDAVVTEKFSKIVFSKNSSWGYKSGQTNPSKYYLRDYFNSVIKRNPEIQFTSYTSSDDVMQTLFFNIMKANQPQEWINVSPYTAKEWKNQAKENQTKWLANKNYNVYLDNSCNHSGIRYDDSFYESNNKLQIAEWIDDILKSKYYSIGTEYLIKESNFNSDKKMQCFNRAIESVKE